MSCFPPRESSKFAGKDKVRCPFYWKTTAKTFCSDFSFKTKPFCDLKLFLTLNFRLTGCLKWEREVPAKSDSQRSFWFSWRRFQVTVCAHSLADRTEIPSGYVRRVRDKGFSSGKAPRLWVLLWPFQEHHKMSGAAAGKRGVRPPDLKSRALGYTRPCGSCFGQVQV